MPDINLFKNDKKRFVNEVIWVCLLSIQCTLVAKLRAPLPGLVVIGGDLCPRRH